MGIGGEEKGGSDVVVDASEMPANKSPGREITTREEIGTKETVSATKSVAVFVLKAAVLVSTLVDYPLLSPFQPTLSPSHMNTWSRPASGSYEAVRPSRGRPSNQTRHAACSEYVFAG